MKEEIKHFKSLLRQGSLRHMNILLDDKFQKELQTIIEDYEKLQQETEKLKKQYCERTDCGGRIGNSKKVEELQQENKQLKEKLDCDLQWAFKYEKQVDNWNKLREVIRKKQDYYRYVKDNRYRKFLSELLDKMQELQGNDSDE